MDFSKKHKVIKQRFSISLLLSILKKDTWACIKVFILYGIGSFSLFGCNEDSNKITLSIQEDVVLVQTEIKNYKAPHKITLKNNLALDYEGYNLIFDSGSRIKLQNFNLVISADKIEFKDDVRIIGFDRYDYNDECEINGLDSGSLILKAKVIKGSPLINLKGQNSGRHGQGYYVKQNNGEKHHPDDKAIKGFVKNLCTIKHPINNEMINNYWEHIAFHGGDNGIFKIFKDSDISRFNPNLIGSRSHGNLISFVSYLYEVGSSKVTAWGATPKGNSGTPSLFCVFLENGFESCLEEFSEFVKEINKHSLIESISNM